MCSNGGSRRPPVDQSQFISKPAALRKPPEKKKKKKKKKKNMVLACVKPKGIQKRVTVWCATRFAVHRHGEVSLSHRPAADSGSRTTSARLPAATAVEGAGPARHHLGRAGVDRDVLPLGCNRPGSVRRHRGHVLWLCEVGGSGFQYFLAFALSSLSDDCRWTTNLVNGFLGTCDRHGLPQALYREGVPRRLPCLLCLTISAIAVHL